MSIHTDDYVLFENKGFTLLDCDRGKLVVNSFEDKELILKEAHHWLSYTACLKGSRRRSLCGEYEIINNTLLGRIHLPTVYLSDSAVADGIYSRKKVVPYNGAFVIGRPVDVWTGATEYVMCEEAYELHFTNGVLDDCLDLRKGIDELLRFWDASISSDALGKHPLNDDYKEAIAVQHLKYEYDLYSTMYSRNEKYEFDPVINANRRKKLNQIYTELKSWITF